MWSFWDFLGFAATVAVGTVALGAVVVMVWTWVEEWDEAETRNQ